MFFLSFSVVFFFVQAGIAASRTSPPSGAVVVRAGTTASGELKSIQAAVDSLPNEGSSRSIFIYPEDIGYTTDTSTYIQNQATITFTTRADNGTSNETGTLRIHTDNFKMYNVNVKNTRTGIQAGALSQYGNRVGFYGCSFYGYQDTLYANEGTQGKTDFIYGRRGQAYFGGDTIAVRGAGYIPSSGRQSDDAGSYVFNENSVIQASDAESGTSGGYYLGRPLSPYANHIQNTVLNVPPSKELWSLWNGDVSSVAYTLFADYKTSGPGASGLVGANFATVASDSQANSYSISSAVGSDYASWVDISYLV